MQREFWRRVHARALSTTRKFLGLEFWGQIMLRAFAGIAAIAGFVLWGSVDAALDEVIFRTVGVCFVLGIFPLVYVWNFSRVPAEIDDENKKTIENNMKTIATATTALVRKITTRITVLTLSILLENGYELSVERITENQFDDWLSKVQNWGETTVRYLANKFSHQEAVALKNVQYHLNENFIFKVHDEHNRQLQQLTMRLKNLKAIVGRYEQDWSPISSQERILINSSLVIFETQATAADGEQALNEEGS